MVHKFPEIKKIVIEKSQIFDTIYKEQQKGNFII